MFVKREDGLGPVFLPFDIAALILAALLTIRCGTKGLLAVPVFLGWWICCFAGLLLAFYFVVWLISLTVDMKKPAPADDHPVCRAIVVYVIAQLCRFARLRIHYMGDEKLPAGRFLAVSNHRSAYDPISTVWALRKRPTAIITKPENHRIPIAGPMIYQANFLPIDRSDPREAMKTINAAAELLKNDVVSVGIYPEGTRNKTPEEGLLPFHNGVFKIAQKAGVPLAVMTVRGTEDIGRNFPWRRTEVYLHVCEVIGPGELKGSTAAVSERVREIMERDLAAAEEDR